MESAFEVPDELLNIAGNCPRAFLSCLICNTGTSVAYINLEGNYSWCLSLTCSQCQEHWFVCRMCDSNTQRVQISDTSSRRRHHRRYHMRATTQPARPWGNLYATSSEEEEESEHHHQYDTGAFGATEHQPNTSNPELEQKFSDLLTTSASPPELLLESFGRDKSIQYFSAQLQGGGAGAAQLVSHSQFGVSSLANQLYPSHVSAQLLLSEFVFSLTRNQRHMFADVLKDVVQLVREESSRDSDCSSNLSCTVPQTYSQIRSFYTEGADAIMPNLPHPPVKNIAGHSYMSLSHIVSDFLAFCSEMDLSWDKKEADIHSPSKLPDSVRGRKIFEEAQRANDGRPTLPVIYTKWSDNFEPNSQSKQSRGSVWCCCITFLTPYANAHSTNNTYVVAIGEKDLDHQENSVISAVLTINLG